jgi:Helix-turn-helix domain
VTKRDIADALQRRREELGMTVVDAVQASGVSRTTWRELANETRDGLSAPVGAKLDEFLDWPTGTAVKVFRASDFDSNGNCHPPPSNGTGHDQVTPEQDAVLFPTPERDAELTAQRGTLMAHAMAAIPAGETLQAVTLLAVFQQLPPAERADLLREGLLSLARVHA